jgi:class 3 adenylate cyclase
MMICPSCGHENPEGNKFCGECAAPLAPTPTSQAEERKVVTVLFCDLVGFTAHSDQADPEDVRARIRPYHSRLRQEIERYGGTVEKFIGDAVMAVFGAPVAHEDDTERAVRAGLTILGAISELNEEDAGLDLQVRVGIETGEAVVALGARPEEGEGIVTGDVVNTASRLQGAAPVGGVAVGEGTYGATRDLFDYEVLEPVILKGKASPVAIYHAKSARARFGTDLTRKLTTPLVGRELERTLLTGTFERSVRDASVQMITVVGEPGGWASPGWWPSCSPTSRRGPTSSGGARGGACPTGMRSPSGPWGRSSRPRRGSWRPMAPTWPGPRSTPSSPRPIPTPRGSASA